MPWFRDTQAPLGARLRTLLVPWLAALLVFVMVVLEIPLRALGTVPVWLNLGGTGTTANVLLSTGGQGEPELAAASKHKHGKHKHGKHKHGKHKHGKHKHGKHKHGKKAGSRNKPDPTPTPTPPPGGSATLLAAGDIAGCSTNGDEATAKLLDGLAGTVATLGDNVYESGTASEFIQCYEPTWGRHKSRTKPAPGNHEYLTSGASGYYGYFGAAAGDSTKGYYSYELGSWHIVVLNSNCSAIGGCTAGSAQETWLRQDLAANPTSCTLAYWHHPRFSFGEYSNDPRMQALWQALDEAGAEIVLSGHDHNYQRYAPLNPDGTRDDASGIRQFVVGTGGRSHYALGSPPANVEASNSDTFGDLQLTLHPTSYDWVFIPIAGQSFTDAGSGICH
jgi:acid phosphatase type 7